MKYKTNWILFFLFFTSVIPAQTNFPPVSDLDTLYRTLTQNHPKLICGKNRDLFDSLYFSIRTKYSKFSHDKKILEMTRLVASLHDGHTKVGISFDTAAHFHQLPIRIYLYEDGVFIKRVSEKYGKYAGMKILKIGSYSIDTVINKVMPFIHGENESAARDILPSRIIIPEVLNYIGAVSKIDSVNFQLEDPDGNTFSAWLGPDAMNADTKWVSARNTDDSPPLYLSNTNKNYWFTYNDSARIFYFQFNVVQDNEEQPFGNFVDSMFRKIDSLPVNKMIIDIRNNNGGDNTLNKYLIHALIRCDKINQKGKLFAVIGRLTFSAAVNLTADLESNTNVIFVGEPTATGPNHYGETNVLRLPASQLIVLYSSQYWQSSFPWDHRTSIEPGISVKLYSRNYKYNEDPCYEAIEKY